MAIVRPVSGAIDVRHSPLPNISRLEMSYSEYCQMLEKQVALTKRIDSLALELQTQKEAHLEKRENIKSYFARTIEEVNLCLAAEKTKATALETQLEKLLKELDVANSTDVVKNLQKAELTIRAQKAVIDALKEKIHILEPQKRTGITHQALEFPDLRVGTVAPTIPSRRLHRRTQPLTPSFPSTLEASTRTSTLRVADASVESKQEDMNRPFTMNAIDYSQLVTNLVYLNSRVDAFVSKIEIVTKKHRKVEAKLIKKGRQEIENLKALLIVEKEKISFLDAKVERVQKELEALNETTVVKNLQKAESRIEAQKHKIVALTSKLHVLEYKKRREMARVPTEVTSSLGAGARLVSMHPCESSHRSHRRDPSHAAHHLFHRREPSHTRELARRKESDGKRESSRTRETDSKRVLSHSREMAAAGVHYLRTPTHASTWSNEFTTDYLLTHREQYKLSFK